MNAEDLVQETLMVPYGRVADKDAGIENFKSYLFKMAINHWINWCRRKKMALDFTSAVAVSSESAIYQDEMHVVQDSLSTLLNYPPPRERVVL